MESMCIKVLNIIRGEYLENDVSIQRTLLITCSPVSGRDGT
jgi:hypothetical protein